MFISDQQYLNWQKKLSDSTAFRRFWSWWAFYGILFAMAFSPYYLTFKGGWKILVLAFLSGLVAHYVFCKLIHLIHKKPHPYQRLKFKVETSRVFSLSDDVQDAFPSEHVTTMAAVVTIFFLFWQPLGYVGFAILILVAVARIILGYHDVSDVFWGSIFGALSGLLVAHFLVPVMFK